APAGEELLGSKLDDDDERLEDDPPAHLRLPDAPVPEGDRHLDDPRLRSRGPEGHLDLEHVAAGMDAGIGDRRERGRSPRLEPAGQVMWLEPEDDARE